MTSSRPKNSTFGLTHRAKRARSARAAVDRGTGSTTGRSSCWTGRRAFSEGGGGARACWERGVSKSVVLLTGDRGFESLFVQQRVVQTIGSSAVELTSLILGRSVRVTSATHGEAELEDTVRALRKPGVSGRSGFSPPARAAD